MEGLPCKKLFALMGESYAKPDGKAEEAGKK